MGFNKRQLTIALGGAALVLAVAQCVSMLGSRIETGDMFADYSTLRADPMGMMALYNALDALPQYDTLQYVRPFEELPNGRDTTLVIAGAGLGMDPLPILESLEGFIATGGRAVVAFHPLDNDYMLREFRRSIRARDRARERKEARKSSDQNDGKEDLDTPVSESEDEDPADDDTAAEPGEEGSAEGDVDAASADNEAKEEKAEEDEEALDALMPVDPDDEDISERWGFDYGFEMPLSDAITTRSDDTLPVEEQLRLRSALYFKDLDDSWTPIYVRPDGDEESSPYATVIEKKLGLGTIVVCSDAYFMSNEALRKDRVPQLIQWAMGKNRTLLFSEVHLGNGQQDRIMTLVRRYRLHGVLGGLVLIGFLFIWKNATTLLPRRERMLAARATEERSQQVGLDNLLTRFVSPPSLLATCVQEWRQHVTKKPGTEAVEALYQATRETGKTTNDKDDIVTMYNEIVQKVQRRTP